MAAAGKVRTGCYRDSPVGIIAIGSDTAGEFSLDAGIVLVEHEVHDAGQRVGAIDGRGAPGHHVDPRDQFLWEIVDVHDTRNRRWHRALTVEQNQSSRGAQVSTIQGNDADCAGAETLVVVLVRVAAIDRGQLGHNIGDIGRRRRLKIVRAQNCHWRGRLVIGTGNERAGDDNCLDIPRVLIRRARGLRANGPDIVGKSKRANASHENQVFRFH